MILAYTLEQIAPFRNVLEHIATFRIDWGAKYCGSTHIPRNSGRSLLYVLIGSQLVFVEFVEARITKDPTVITPRKIINFIDKNKKSLPVLMPPGTLSSLLNYNTNSCIA